MDQNEIDRIFKHNGASNNKGKEYIWRTEKDGKVRPEHRVREGKKFRWDSPPPGGHPGDDYGCRCWAEPVLEDAEENINTGANQFDRVNQMKAKIAQNLEKLEELSGRNVNTPEARELMLGTAIIESDIKYRRQITQTGANGRGRGLMQMEPETFDDIWNRFLKFPRNRSLKNAIEKEWLKRRQATPELLLEDDDFAIIMARIRYMYDRGDLPAVGDTKSQAEYWRRVYNGGSSSGRTAREFEEQWRHYMD